MSGRLATIGAALLCVTSMIAFAGQAQKSPPDDEPQVGEQSERDRWMIVKLTSTQQILEHLTSGDFEKMEASARRMQVINLLEKWQRDEDFADKSDYQGRLNTFEFSLKELIRHAGDKNTDGALKAYLGMTESCVRCHQLIRDRDTK
jgi:hypothetical protein